MEYKELVECIKTNKDISAKLIKIKKQSNANSIFLNALILIHRELIASKKYESLYKLINDSCVLIYKELKPTTANKNKLLTVLHGLFVGALDHNDFEMINTFFKFALEVAYNEPIENAELRNIYAAFFAKSYNKFVKELWRNRYTNEEDLKFLIDFIMSAIKFCLLANAGKVVAMEKIFPIIQRLQLTVSRKNLNSKHFHFLLQKLLRLLLTQTFDSSKLDGKNEISNYVLELFAIMSLHTSKSSQETAKLFHRLLENLNLKSLCQYVDLFDRIIEICAKSKQLDESNLNAIYKLVNINDNNIPEKIFLSLSNVLVEVFNLDLNCYKIENSNHLSLLGKILNYCANNLMAMKIEKCNCNDQCATFKSEINGAILWKYLISFYLDFLQKYSLYDLNLLDSFDVSILCLQQSFKTTNCTNFKVTVQNIFIQYGNLFREIIKCNVSSEDAKVVLGPAKRFSALVYDIRDLVDKQKFMSLLQYHLYIIYQLRILLEEYELALVPLALSVADFGFESNFKLYWYIGKSKIVSLNLSHLQSVSVTDILLEQTKELVSLREDYNICEYNMEKVALRELECLDEFWPEPRCLAAAIKSVLKHSNDIWIKAKALAVLSKSFSIFLDKDLEQQLDLVLQQFVTIVEKENGNRIVESKIILANLFALKYFFGYYFLRYDNPSKAIRLKKNDETIKEKYEISGFEIEAIKNLDKAMEMYSEIYNCLSKKNIDLIPLFTNYKSVKTIEIIANFYLLHNFELNFINASILCYKYAEITDNFAVQLNQLASLIENLSYDLPLWKKISEMAMKLIGKMKEEELADVIELEVNFLISQSWSLFFSNQFREGYRLVDQITKLIATNTNDIMEMKFEMLKMQYFSLPCNFSFDGHERILLMGQELYRRLKQINYSYCRLDVAPKKVINIMNFLSFWGKLLERLCLLREAKYFFKQLISLTSQAGLSLRCAQILSNLCEIDLQTSNLEDCQVKLEEMDNLLSNFDNFIAKNVFADMKIIRYKLDVNRSDPSGELLSPLDLNKEERIFFGDSVLPSLLTISCRVNDLILFKECKFQYKCKFALNLAFTLFYSRKYKECMDVVKNLFSLLNNHKQRVNNIVVKALELITVLHFIENESKSIENKFSAVKKTLTAINDCNKIVKTPKIKSEIGTDRAVTALKSYKFFKSRTPANNFTIYSTEKNSLKPPQTSTGLSPKQNFDRLFSPHVLPCKSLEQNKHKETKVRKNLAFDFANDPNGKKKATNNGKKSQKVDLNAAQVNFDDDLVGIDFSSDSSENSADSKKSKSLRVTHLKNKLSKQVAADSSKPELAKISVATSKLPRKIRSRLEPSVVDLTAPVEQLMENMTISENATPKDCGKTTTKKLPLQKANNLEIEVPTVENSEAGEVEEEKPKRRGRKKKNPFILT